MPKKTTLISISPLSVYILHIPGVGRTALAKVLVFPILMLDQKLLSAGPLEPHARHSDPTSRGKSEQGKD